MKFGNFSESKREYVISNPATPYPWINYISNENGYCGIVSQTGGGFSFYGDPRTRRLTKYHYNNLPMDRPGRYFFIRDEADGSYWSPTFQPAGEALSDYECRHGLGYTTIHSRKDGLLHDLTYFVPDGGRHECWCLKLENTGPQPLRLSLYSYVEFTFWSEAESRNQQWSAHLTRASFDGNAILYSFIEGHPSFIRTENANYNPDRPGMAFLTWNQDIDDFETVRDRFIGPYRHEGNPAGLGTPVLGNSLLSGGVGCGAIRKSLEIPAGGSVEIVVLMGFAESTREIADLRASAMTSARVREQLSAAIGRRLRYLEAFQVATADPVVNTLFNTWHPYQCRTAYDWSRYISYFENGEGRGMGTRDSFQDLLGICPYDSGAVGRRILEIVEACQFSDGSCYHQFFPLLKKGDLHGFSDDHLWSVLAVDAYVRETGDLTLLETKIPFTNAPDERVSLYQHLVRALEFVANNLGDNGIPLILNADWNDTLHLWMKADRPESVLVGMLYVRALRIMCELAGLLGRPDEAKAFASQADSMSDTINARCWDGQWYLRGFANGPIGSSRDTVARIFLNTQSWAVISGVATAERSRICMDSVHRELQSEYGLKVLAPCFQQYDPRFGLISRYVPGHKENGIFAHAVAWAIIATAKVGLPDEAYACYRKITPAFHNDKADRLKTEPYVYCQTIASEDSLYPLEGANSWLTGTASWMHVAVSQYIFGIRPGLDGLIVDPSMPREWDEFSVTRVFRDCRYNIHIRRGTEASVRVNGAPHLFGQPIPAEQGSVLEVEVLIC